jgi:hypothetical protein
MTDIVLDINMVPEALFSRIKAERVKIREENGAFVLIPINDEEKTFDRLIGMFSDGKLSIDGYLREKRLERELEH